jgi:hypothetical protein
MAFGGTTFGRQVGGPLIVTSYDYDVHVNEYGLRAEPKYSLLSALHRTLLRVSPVLLGQDTVPAAVPLEGNSQCDTITYSGHSGNSEGGGELGCVAFLSNVGESDSCSFNVHGVAVQVPAWSVSIVSHACAEEAGLATVMLNTKSDAASLPANALAAQPLADFALSAFRTYSEPVPSSRVPAVLSLKPLDQLSVTGDDTDYLWVSVRIPASTADRNSSLSFTVGDGGGPVVYAFVNGALAASSIDITNPVSPAATLAATAAAAIAVGTQATDLVRDATRRHSRRDTSPAAGSEAGATSSDVLVKLSLFLPASSSSDTDRLDLLFASTGVKNYGPYLEQVVVGLTSEVFLDGVAVPPPYASVPGLNGESLLHAAAGPFAQAKQPPRELRSAADTQRSVAEAQRRLIANTTSSAANMPLTWYRATFATPASLVQQGDHEALALDLSATSLVKGAVWVNGFMLGRYWNVLAAGDVSSGACGECQWLISPNVCMFVCLYVCMSVSHLSECSLLSFSFFLLLFSSFFCNANQPCLPFPPPPFVFPRRCRGVHLRELRRGLHCEPLPHRLWRPLPGAVQAAHRAAGPLRHRRGQQWQWQWRRGEGEQPCVLRGGGRVSGGRTTCDCDNVHNYC